jgi:hypothetical protein
VLTMGVSLLTWMVALRRLEVSQTYPFTSLGIVPGPQLISVAIVSSGSAGGSRGPRNLLSEHLIAS